MKATQLLHDPTEPNLREALLLFTSATERDTSFARAYAGIAETWLHLGARGYEDFSPMFEMMGPAARRSLELGLDLAEPHLAMGNLYFAQDLYEEARAEIEKTIQLNPNLAYALLGVMRAALSRLDDAVTSFERRYELDPLSIDSALSLSRFYAWAGRQAESFDVLQRTLQLNPRNPSTHQGFASYYTWYEDYAKAQESIDKARELGGDEYDQKWLQGMLYALTGKREKAEELIEYYKGMRRKVRVLVGYST